MRGVPKTVKEAAWERHVKNAGDIATMALAAGVVI